MIKELFIKDLKQSKYHKLFNRNNKTYVRFLDSSKDKICDWIFSKPDFELIIKPILIKNKIL